MEGQYNRIVPPLEWLKFKRWKLLSFDRHLGKRQHTLPTESPVNKYEALWVSVSQSLPSTIGAQKQLKTIKGQRAPTSLYVWDLMLLSSCLACMRP